MCKFARKEITDRDLDLENFVVVMLHHLTIVSQFHGQA